MKQLKRNKRKFYYAINDPDAKAEEIIDENGYRTGEYYPIRIDPVEVWGNISIPTGFANIEKFGNIVSYDIVITMEDPNTPINESCVLWVYNNPNNTDENGNPEPWDFMVRRVARSLNSVTLQCAQAKVKYNYAKKDFN